MDAEERPTKLRKIDHDATSAELMAATPDQPSSVPVTDTGTEVESAQNGFNDAQIKREDDSVQDLSRSDDAEVKQEDEAGESLPAPADVAPIANEGTADAPAMSKNQLKKLRKKQEWESKRDERKVIRKEKAVAKRERKREAKQKAAAEGGEDYEAEKKKKQQVRAVQLPVTFIIDCDFDDLMRDNERISLGSQLTRSYSDNKNSKFRAHITISSWGGQLRDRFDSVMGGMHNLWRGTRFLDEDFVETAEKAKGWMSDKEGGLFKGAFAKYDALDEAAKEELKQQGEVVYLSSESDDTLTELKPYSTYIIGGLVDKNREKGICYKRATQRGIRTAKLPIGQYLEMSSRKVLATNHVNEIMLRWLECGDWGAAFMRVIPKRKGGKLREAGGEKETSADASDDEDDIVEDCNETNDANGGAPAETAPLAGERAT